MSCALHLAKLIKKHNESGAKPELSTENIYVLEKGREIGAHQLSGAIMNPKALAELVPDFEKSAGMEDFLELAVEALNLVVGRRL